VHKIGHNHIFFLGGHFRSENWSQIVNMEGVIIKKVNIKKNHQNFMVLGSMINCEKKRAFNNVILKECNSCYEANNR